MADIQLVTEGPDAKVVADELSKLILDHFGHETKPVPMETARPDPNKKIDPTLLLGVAGLILAIPAAALKVMDLADRLKKRNKATIFLEKVKSFLEAHPDTEIVIHKPDGTIIRIQEIDADTLLDFAAKAAE